MSSDQPTRVQTEQSTSTNLISLYNSLTLSDITIILPRATEVKKRKKAGAEPEDERARIFAHKVILGSGSLLLEKHFKKVKRILFLPSTRKLRH